MVLRDFLLAQIEKEPPTQCCERRATKAPEPSKVGDGHALEA
jgi:hypothetical protein